MSMKAEKTYRQNGLRLMDITKAREYKRLLMMTVDRLKGNKINHEKVRLTVLKFKGVIKKG